MLYLVLTNRSCAMLPVTPLPSLCHWPLCRVTLGIVQRLLEGKENAKEGRVNENGARNGEDMSISSERCLIAPE